MNAFLFLIPLDRACPARFLSTFIALLMLVLASSQLSAASPGRPPAPVEIALATTKPMAPLTWLPGTVVSRNDAQLSAEITDRLIWVAEVGDVVKRGDVVARIKSNTARYTLQRFEAEVKRESARSTFLQDEVKRLKRLARSKNVSQSLLEQTTSELKVSLNQLQSNQAQLRLAEGNLSRTELRAPFDGVVTERLLMPGEWAESGNPVLRLVDTSQLEIKVAVPVRYLGLVSVSQPIRFRLNDRAGEGKVRAKVPVGDEQSQQFDLRISLPADGVWAPGQAMRVAIPVAKPRQALVVPRDALVLRRDGIRVFRVNGDHSVAEVSVTTGIAAEAVIEVIGSLKAGDQVVTRGGERLRAGQTVRVIGAEAAE